MKPNITQVEEPDYEEMILKGQEKLNDEIADAFVDVYKTIRRLEKLGGEMDYKVYILKILGAADEDVPMSMLSKVLPDHAALTKARDELEKEEHIVVTAVKNRKSLALASKE